MSHGTVLGFDFGTRRIGVAVGQTLTASARPLTTLRANHAEADWAAIGLLIREWQPAQLVVGLPINMDGGEHELATTVRAFAEQLRIRYGLPVHLIDERLSSHEAQRIAVGMGGRGASYNRAVKEKVDRIAARVILETWLSQHNSKR